MDKICAKANRRIVITEYSGWLRMVDNGLLLTLVWQWSTPMYKVQHRARGTHRLPRQAKMVPHADEVDGLHTDADY
ncbi:MAG: hypothetical protein AAF639_25055 [Chloroflexota bacterium]